MMTLWMAALIVAGSSEPVVTATRLESEEQCFRAAEAMKKADMEVRGVRRDYTVICAEYEVE